MASGVNVAQMLVLTNLKSRQDAICRVVKVRNFSNTQSYVEVEFTQPQAKFWGVYFPSESGAGRRPPSASVPRPSAKPTVARENVGPSSDAPSTSAPKPVKAGAHSKEANPARVPSPPPSGKPASLFASIAPQQKPQLEAGVSRTEASLSKPAVSEKQTYARELPRSDLTLGLAMAPSDTTSLSPKESTKAVEPFTGSVAQDLLPKHPTLGPEAIANTDVVLDSLGSESLASDAVGTSTESFDAHLDMGLTHPGSTMAEPRQNWMLIGACIIVLFGAVASGVWYFRAESGAGERQDQSSSIGSGGQSTVSSPAQGPGSTEPFPGGLTSGSATAPGQTDFSPASSAETAAMTGTAASSTKNDASAPVQPNAAAAETKPTRAPRNMFASKMKAHPLSSARSQDSQSQAPVLDDAATPAPAPEALPGLNSSGVSVPLPPGFTAEGLAAGRAKEPKLISSVMPVYPSVAKMAHVEGDVVIDAQINKSGNGVHMTVISGPAMLQQAALDALHRWKYQPQQLDGKPVEGELLVKIKFRL